MRSPPYDVPRSSKWLRLCSAPLASRKLSTGAGFREDHGGSTRKLKAPIKQHLLEFWNTFTMDFVTPAMDSGSLLLLLLLLRQDL